MSYGGTETYCPACPGNAAGRKREKERERVWKEKKRANGKEISVTSGKKNPKFCPRHKRENERLLKKFKEAKKVKKLPSGPS